MTEYHPAKWSLICWVAILTLALPALILNYPFTPPWQAGVTSSYKFGFPYLFATLTHQPSGTIVTKIAWPELTATFLVLLANVAALVFVIQFWSQRFSIRTLLWLVTASGALVAITSQLYHALDIKTFEQFLKISYFTPIGLGFATTGFIVARLIKRKSKQKTPVAQPTDG